ncbi:MAG TPA: hypothetical protein VFS67_36615 [Polyangiaceae bacterium]|jgi:hypothetical protein|nr:hypothetical protein [Polyangiaceae bacterium]
MNLATRRIVLEPSPAAVAPAGELEAFFVGHAPGGARPERLAASSEELRLTRQRLGAIGFQRVLSALDRYVSRGEVPTGRVNRLRVSGLYHLPLPVGSPAELRRLFPDAATTACQRTSRLAGERAWLTTAVEDFFHAGGRRAWVVVVPEDEGRAAFLPRPQRTLREDLEELTGAELVAACPEVALLLVPDLERLQVPARTALLAGFEPPPAEPRFLPCAGGDVQVAPPEPAEPVADEPWPHGTVLARLAGFLAAIRPDVQLLMAPPPELEDGAAALTPSRDALEQLAGLPGAVATRVQPLWPYLRSARSLLASPCAVVAGAISKSARERGAWRSVAGEPLLSDAVPFPALGALQAARLREEHALGVLLTLDGQLQLDDERCRASEWADSAELVRFIGDLRRRLTRFGERLVFVVDPDDPRLEIGLERFFTGLHQAGALRGKTADASFTLTRRELGESAVAWDIALAPAYPIDRIVLSFVHTRERSGVELTHG